MGLRAYEQRPGVARGILRGYMVVFIGIKEKTHLEKNMENGAEALG